MHDRLYPIFPATSNPLPCSLHGATIYIYYNDTSAADYTPYTHNAANRVSSQLCPRPLCSRQTGTGCSSGNRPACVIHIIEYCCLVVRPLKPVACSKLPPPQTYTRRTIIIIIIITAHDVCVPRVY